MTDPNPTNDTATDTDTLTPESDLSITKDDGIESAIPGGSTTYTIVVTNKGPSTAVDQQVTDNFPSAITSVSWTAVASSGSSVAAASGSGNILTAVTLLPGGTATFTAVAQIDPSASGSLVNTATVEVPPGDNTPADNSATDTDSLTPVTGLAISKTDGQTTAVPGTSTTYTIVVSNAGPSDAIGATLSDPLPLGVTSAAWTFVSETGGGAVTGPDSGTGALDTTINLPVGATLTFRFTAAIDPTATGTLTNIATVTPPGGTPSSGTDTDTLTPEADLAVTKDDGKTSVVPGTSDTYTITVSNNGPSTVSSVILTDDVPAALLNPVFGTPSAGSYNAATGVWSGLSLATGQSVTITLTGTIDPTATGTLTNTVHVAPPAGVTDLNLANNDDSDTDTLTPQADLAVTKDDGKTSVVPGTSDTYTITVTNNGPSTVSSVILTDTVPPELLNPVFGTPSAGSYDPLTGRWSGLSLGQGQSVTITLTGTIDPVATGTLTNTVQVAPPPGVTDPNPANDTATDTDTLAPQSDLSITKTDGVSSVVPGTADTYLIVVSNHGPSAVTGASVSDALPAGVTSATWTQTDSSGGGSVTGPTSGAGALATIVDLPVNASVTFSFTVQIDPSATGTLTNTATVTPPPGTTDPNPTNDSTTDTDTLTPQADLSITKSDGVTSVVPGTSNTYTIVVSNKGPSTAVDQQVTDLFPSAITAVNWTAVASSGSSVASSSGSGDINTTVTLLPGGTVTFTAVAQIDPSATGTLSNTATVAVPPGDNTPADNSATDTDSLTVVPLTITKDDGQTTAVPGGTTTYTIVVSNNNPPNVKDAILFDPLPAGVTDANWTFVSATGGDNVTGPTSGTGALDTTIDMPPHSTITFSYTVTIDPSATGTLTNIATVTPPGGTPTSASDTDILTPQADLAVTKDDGKTTAVPGTPDTYTITVTNNGLSTVSSVILTDDVPVALLNPVFGTPSDGSYDPTTGVWSGLSLGQGQSVTITLTGTIAPTATGTLTNTVHVAPPAGVTDTNLANNNDSDTDTLTPQADLSIIKSDNVTSVVPGTSDTYTIVVSNHGPSAVTGASVSDALPAGVTSATWTQTDSSGGGTVTGPTSGAGALATIVDLPVDASVIFSFTVQIDPSATGTLTNTATIKPPPGVTDPNPANDTSTDNDTLTPQSDLSITKTDGVTSLVPGTSTTYTIVVTNAGPSTAVDQQVTDLFPSEITSVSWTAVASPGSSVAAASGSGDINTTITLLPGGTVTFTAVAQISSSATGSLSNTATVAVPPGDNTPEDNSATDTDSLTPQTGLSVSKSDDTTTAVPGTGTTYTIVVTNAGPSDVTGAKLSDPLPTSVTAATWTFVGATGGGSVTGPTSGTGALDTTVNVPVHSTVTFRFTAAIDPMATGSLTNIATVTPPGGSTTSGSDTDTLTPQADLAVTKDDGKTSVVPGTSDTYTITVTNNGPSTVSSVILTDDVPPELLNPVFGTPSVGSYDPATGLWSGLSLATGQSVTITLTGTIDPKATGTLTNTAHVAPPPGVTDPNPTNDTTTDTDTLTPQADLAVTKSVSDATPNVGDNITFTVTLTDNGPSTATGVQVTDLLRAGLSFVSDTASQGSYDPAAGLWTVGTVDTTHAQTLTLVAHVVSPGSATNTVTISHADQLDPDLSNNTASVTVTPQQADVILTKLVNQPTPIFGTPVTYTLIAHNDGPDAATAVVATDVLPAGLVFVSATPSQGSFDSGTGRWTIGTLANGATATLQITDIVDTLGPVTNAASATASQFDPDPANNASSVAIDGMFSAGLVSKRSFLSSSDVLSNTAMVAAQEALFNAVMPLWVNVWDALLSMEQNMLSALSGPGNGGIPVFEGDWLDSLLVVYANPFAGQVTAVQVGAFDFLYKDNAVTGVRLS